MQTILFSALSNQSDLLSEIEKIAPAEVVCNEVFYDKYHRHRLFTSRLNIKLSLLDDEYFDYDTAKAILKISWGLWAIRVSEDKTENVALIRANAQCCSICKICKNRRCSISALSSAIQNRCHAPDASTRYHLELISTRGSKKGSLLWVLISAKPPWCTKVESWIESPLNDRKAILGAREPLRRCETTLRH